MLRTYMITGDGDPATILERVVRALEAGVDRVQLRRKGEPARRIERLVEELLLRAPRARHRVLINDRVDVALATGVAGVHLPADGLDTRAVRRVVPPGFEIGVSTHRLVEVERAAVEGADFVVYGPVFPTGSKPGHRGIGLERFTAAVRAVRIPVFALGGVTPARASELEAAGAAGIASISAFENESSLQELMACLR